MKRNRIILIKLLISVLLFCATFVMDEGTASLIVLGLAALSACELTGSSLWHLLSDQSPI